MAEEATTERVKGHVLWSPAVTLGNVLSIGTVVVMVCGFAFGMDGRIGRLEEAGKSRDERIARTDAGLNQQRAEIRDELREIKEGMRRVEDKLDRKADR